jgi:hypothetical protein
MAGNHTTIEHTRKSLKVQGLLATLTLVLGVGLVILGTSSEQKPEQNMAMMNGILTSLAGVVWVVGVRVARWWHHD